MLFRSRLTVTSATDSTDTGGGQGRPRGYVIVGRLSCLMQKRSMQSVEQPGSMHFLRMGIPLLSP
jgi:hypothetical protein